MQLKDNLKYIVTPARVFMTIFIVLIGVIFLQVIVVEIVRMLPRAERATTPEEPEEELSEEEKRLERIRYSTKECLPDGTIHLVHHLGRRFYGQWDESDKEQIYDVNDNLLWEGPGNKRPYEYLSWSKQLRGSYREGFTQQRMRQIQMITPELSQTLEIPVRLQGKTVETWRYVPWKDCFVGYKAGGEKTAYAGATGFVDSKSEVRPFGEFSVFIAWCPEGSYSPTLLWQTQRRIYQIDFEKRQVEMIFESTDSDIGIERTSLHAWRDLKPGAEGSSDPKKYRPLLLCVTGDGKYHLILREPKQQLSIGIGLPGTSVTATKKNIFVRNYWSDAMPPADISGSRELYDKWLQERRGKPRNFWAEFYKVDNQGGLELLNRYDWTVPAPPVPVVKVGDPRPIVHCCVSQFSPPLYDVAAHLLGREFWSRVFNYQNRGDFFYSLARMILDIRPYGGVLNRILSALMMGFVFLHGLPRRTSWARFVFWLIFVGLFNLAGLLTYLALNHTPVIECPACGKRRGLAQAERPRSYMGVCCVRCLAELPAPRRRELDLIVDA